MMKRQRSSLKRITVVLFALLLAITMLPLQTRAAEPDTGTEGSIEEPYLRVDLSALYDEGLVFAPEDSGVIITLDENNGGIRISGPVSALNGFRITIKDTFVFDGNPVGRICVDGLAKGKPADAKVYLDDATAPSAAIALVNTSEDWSKEGNRTEDVYGQRITGAHQVSLGFAVDGEDTETAEILLRNIEFAENSIPVLYFNIDESQGTIDEMHASADHSKNCYGSVDIQVPEGYKSEYMDSAATDQADLKLEYIRGRGNSTWSAAKKPYKVKFDKKQDLFGMGKNKHWVLIANRFDNTLLHNRVTYWLTAQMGMEFTPQCVPVEVVMNGRYFGSYLLCEQLRVEDVEDQNRIAIGEVSDQDITGGYFLSIEPYEKDPDAGKFTTDQGVNFYINDPGYEEEDDIGTEAHKAYISQYVQNTENAIFGEDFKDENGKSYREYLDFDAAVDYWWLQEFSTNHDAYKTPSTYLYKKSDQRGDGKLYWGPIWDFDSETYGNVMYDPATYGETGFFNTCSDAAWMMQLLYDQEFTDALVARWADIDGLLDEIVKENGILDRFVKETEISQRYDNELYGFYDPAGTIADDPDHTYYTDTEQFRSWLKARQSWINNNIDTLENIRYTVTLMVDGQEKPFAEVPVLKTQWPKEIPDPPEKDGYLVLGWEMEDGTMIDDMDWISNEEDITFYASYVSEEDAVQTDDLFFLLPEFWMELKDETFSMNYKLTTVPTDAQEKSVKWTSSDASIASVDEDGNVSLHAPGTVTITATLKNGKSKSVQLHIVDPETPEYADLQEISFEQDTVTMQVGDYTQNVMHLIPEGLLQPDSFISFTSDNEDVVTVDNNGVLYAVGEGTAVITVDEWPSKKTASYTVTVSPKHEEEAADEVSYTFSKGGNGIWTKGDTGTFDLTVHRNVEDDATFSHFKDIAVDGKVLDTKDYDAVSGSLNASLKANYLNTLSAGEHTLSVHFDDGSADTKLAVKEAAASDGSSDKNGINKGDTPGKDTTTKKSTTPKTGDDMHLAVWCMILLAAVAGLIVFATKEKRKMG